MSRSRSWRRLTAGLMVPLIAVLMLQIRYYAPYHVEDINIAAPSSAEPLAITTSPPRSPSRRRSSAPSVRPAPFRFQWKPAHSGLRRGVLPPSSRSSFTLAPARYY